MLKVFAKDRPGVAPDARAGGALRADELVPQPLSARDRHELREAVRKRVSVRRQRQHKLELREARAMAAEVMAARKGVLMPVGGTTGRHYDGNGQDVDDGGGSDPLAGSTMGDALADTGLFSGRNEAVDSDSDNASYVAAVAVSLLEAHSTPSLTLPHTLSLCDFSDNSAWETPTLMGVGLLVR